MCGGKLLPGARSPTRFESGAVWSTSSSSSWPVRSSVFSALCAINFGRLDVAASSAPEWVLGRHYLPRKNGLLFHNYYYFILFLKKYVDDVDVGTRFNYTNRMRRCRPGMGNPQLRNLVSIYLWRNIPPIISCVFFLYSFNPGDR